MAIRRARAISRHSIYLYFLRLKKRGHHHRKIGSLNKFTYVHMKILLGREGRGASAEGTTDFARRGINESGAAGPVPLSFPGCDAAWAFAAVITHDAHACPTLASRRCCRA
jgi:hypothetical protein